MASEETGGCDSGKSACAAVFDAESSFGRSSGVWEIMFEVDFVSVMTSGVGIHDGF
jgi:hypothetical protein